MRHIFIGCVRYYSKLLKAFIPNSLFEWLKCTTGLWWSKFPLLIYNRVHGPQSPYTHTVHPFIVHICTLLLSSGLCSVLRYFQYGQWTMNDEHQSVSKSTVQCKHCTHHSWQIPACSYLKRRIINIHFQKRSKIMIIIFFLKKRKRKKR